MFKRQAIAMVWDYIEIDPFQDVSGDYCVAPATHCSMQSRAVALSCVDNSLGLRAKADVEIRLPRGSCLRPRLTQEAPEAYSARLHHRCRRYA